MNKKSIVVKLGVQSTVAFSWLIYNNLFTSWAVSGEAEKRKTFLPPGGLVN